MKIKHTNCGVRFVFDTKTNRLFIDGGAMIERRAWIVIEYGGMKIKVMPRNIINDITAALRGRGHDDIAKITSMMCYLWPTLRPHDPIFAIVNGKDYCPVLNRRLPYTLGSPVK